MGDPCTVENKSDQNIIHLVPSSGWTEQEIAESALKTGGRVLYVGQYVIGEIEYDPISGNFSIDVYRNGNFNKRLEETVLSRLMRDIGIHFGEE